jgi:hypothetical protein
VFGGVVEEVGCADIFVLVIVNDRRFEDVEGEEVGDLLSGGILAILALYSTMSKL